MRPLHRFSSAFAVCGWASSFRNVHALQVVHVGEDPVHGPLQDITLTDTQVQSDSYVETFECSEELPPFWIFFFSANLLSSLVFSCDRLSRSNLTAAVTGPIESHRGSKCFGCLVSTEAHGDDGFQVLFRNALCWSGPGTRTAARQHQRCCEICTRQQCKEWVEQAGIFHTFLSVLSVFFPSFTWVVHMAHDPVCGSIDSSVPSVINRSLASFQRESHFT